MINTVVFLVCIAAELELVWGPATFILLIYVVMGPLGLTILTVNALINYKDIKQHLQAIFLVLISVAVFVLYFNLLIAF